MALLLRNHASRHYAIATGALFVMGAVAIAVLSIIAPRSGLSRLIGLALAGLLGARGLMRIRQARSLAAASADADEPTRRHG
ncbi:MAG: hypothetical protein IPI49_15390 [Myxococcales bacterium]|nr:hypothetical protein [Myxococcales bacterium]HRC56674.1 hypothetical protein [Kofleriaceae bacterium]